MAHGGGAAGRRSIGAHRPAAAARSGRQRHQGSRCRSSFRSTASNGPRRRAADAGKPIQKVGQVLAPGDVDLCRADGSSRANTAAPGAGNFRRHGGDGSAHRPRARHGRRLLLRPEPVQSRHAGDAPAGLLVQAASFMRPRSTTATRRRPSSWTRRSRSIWGRAAASGSRRITAANSIGPSTLRFGLEQSRNVMTVRLAQDIGMPLIAEYAKRFGVYDELPPYLSYALGAGETTVMRMVTAYSMFDNGGRRVIPTLIDRIQDRYGHTIYKHDQRECAAATPRTGRPAGADAGRQARAGDRSDDRLPDHLDDGRRRPARHRDGRCARSASRSPARPAPPTTRRTSGSSASRPTSSAASIWAYDKPRHIGRGATGGASRRADRARLHEGGARRQAADPVPRAAGHQADPRRLPRPACAPVRAIRTIILEAFKPGTAPPDSYSVHRRRHGQWRRRLPQGIVPTPAMSSAPAPAGSIESRSQIADFGVSGRLCYCAASTLIWHLVTEHQNPGSCAPKSPHRRRDQAVCLDC